MSFAPPAFQLMASSLSDNPNTDSNADHNGPAQLQTDGESVGDFTPGETDSKAPDLESYRGEEVNLIGRICSDEANYGSAVSSGMNLRSKPLPTADAVIGQLRYNTNVTVKSTNQSGGWYFVIADNGTAGWINQAFVALHPPDSGSVLHHVTEPDLTTILKNHYVQSGLWKLETGDDYTTLAAAVKIANAGRKGIYIDLKKRKSYKDDNPMRETFDPMSENFADYASAQVVMGTNIWLPSPGFIDQLKENGAVASRADWLNTAMDMGDALVGFHAGMYSGIYGSLWDTLVGLYNIGEQIVGLVKKCFTGEILEDVSGIYSQVKAKFEEIAAMSQNELMAFAGDLLGQFTTAICDGAQAFADSWTHPDSWKKWFFRGKVIGQIVLEVVLAIFTAGAGTAAKWLGTIGKFSPKLARIVSKGINKADDLLPSGMKKNRDKPDSDGPDRKKDKDGDGAEEGGAERALLLARQITEMHDARNSPIPVLKGALAGIQRTFKGVKGYQVDPKPGQSGHYTVVQMMPKKVDDDYTTGASERQNTESHENAGGHTDARHIGKSDNWLRKRLKDDPNLQAASTFTNEAAANRTQGRFVKKYKTEIAEWLKRGGNGTFVRSIDTKKPIGRVLPRGKHHPEGSSKAMVIVAKNDSDLGYYIVTSYPIK